jgi:hypothetical protein
MMGEALREIAILSAVFFMLDNLMKDNPAAAYPLGVSIYVLVGCIATFTIGVLFEVYRAHGD